jgi:hypothetical protein
MAVNLSPVGGVAGQFFDNNGNPLTGGKIYTYSAGTSTNQATYTTAAGVTAHSNPIILDAGGRVPGGEIWLSDGAQYKFVIKTSVDVLIGTYDNIQGINSVAANTVTFTPVGTIEATNVQTAIAEVASESVQLTALAASSGSSLIGYLPNGTGAVPTTVQNELRQYVSVLNFGVNTIPGTTDMTDAFEAALVYLAGTNSYEGAKGLFVPGGIYRITRTLNVTLATGSLTIFSDTKATIYPDSSIGLYTFYVDYATGATANFVTFNMTNIAINDISAAQTRNGIRMKRVIGSKFTQCEFNNLNLAVNMDGDSNLNTFDTCMWRGNVQGWASSDQVANNNVFLNCQWRYNSGTAADFTGTSGNVFIGGDFEPGNANPVLIANGMTIKGTRFERNIQGEIIRVLDNNEIECSVLSDGGTQALPAYNLVGSNNNITATSISAGSFVTYQSTAANNNIKIKSNVAMVANTSTLVYGPDTNEVILTNGSMQSNTTGALVEVIKDELVPSDLTTWTKVNCTVTKSGEKYTIVSVGAGAAYIYYGVAGAKLGMRMALTTEPANASGQLLVSLGAGSVNTSNWPSPGRRRVIVGQFDYTSFPISNPVISLTLTGTSGAGAACDVYNVRTTELSRIPE